MDIYKVKAGRRTEVAKQARLDVVDRKGSIEKRILLEVDLADG
jgi:hypothetical protein